MHDVTDIGETLAQLDRRLRDIRQQILTIAQAAEPGPDPLAAEPSVRAQAPYQPEPTPQAHHEPPPQAQPEPPPQMQHEPPPAPVEDPPGASSPASSAEIERLLALRQQLLQDARELIGAFERQIDALEAVQDERSQTRWLFEGPVAVVVSGIHSIRTVAALEESLSAIPGVGSAQVLDYHSGEARFELQLGGPVELLSELPRALPWPFEVRSVTREEIALGLDDGSGTDVSPALETLEDGYGH